MSGYLCFPSVAQTNYTAMGFPMWYFVIDKFQLCLTQSIAQTFSKESLKDTTDELRDSMYNVGKTALELEADKKDRLQRKAEEDQRRKEQGVAPEPVKRVREEEGMEESTDNTDADVDYYPGQEDRPASTKKPRKTTSLQALLQPDTKEYRTTAADREERMKERQKMETQEISDSTENIEQTEGAEAEGEAVETEKERLERDIEQQQKEIEKLEKQKKQEHEMSSRHKAKEFQQMITKGAWMKEKDRTPRIVSTEKRKKSAGFTSQKIERADEEEEEEDYDEPPMPEGFHLLHDDVHCKNIRKAEGFQHYMRAICTNFEPIVKKGVNIPTNYTKLVRSIYWAGRAVGISSMEDADVEAVIDNIKDTNCRAWMLHLRGIQDASPQDLLPASQRESFTVKAPTMDPDIDKMLNDEVAEMTPLKENAIRNSIKQLCHHNAMAHRHAAMASEELETLSMNVSIPFFLKVAESTSRPLITLRLPSMDAHMDKTERIRKAREEEYRSQIEPTINLAVKQNLVTMNDDWRESKDGRATRILAAFVNRYVYEQMFLKTGKVLSAKTLGETFDLKESTLGKLLSARRYLGGREAGFYKKRREATEQEGTEKSATEAVDHDKV